MFPKEVKEQNSQQIPHECLPSTWFYAKLSRKYSKVPSLQALTAQQRQRHTEESSREECEMEQCQSEPQKGTEESGFESTHWIVISDLTLPCCVGLGECLSLSESGCL